MPFALRNATASDAEAITEVYMSAFSQDAVSLLVFPRNSPGSYKFWHENVIEDLSDPHSHFLCITDPTSPSPSSIIAFAKWKAPSASVSLEMPEWPAGGDHELANFFFSSLLRRHEEIMRGRRHWYLEILATRREDQGKGAGGMLLRWGLERADEEGMETYLEASPDGKPIYQRFGFAEVDRLVVDLKEEVLGEREFVECYMLRPAIVKSV